MTMRTFLTVAAVAAFIFGFGLLFLPGPLMAIYGMRLDAVSRLLAQLHGGTILGFATLNWLARGIDPQNVVVTRPILASNLVFDIITFVVGLIAQLDGQAAINALGWSTILMFLLFTIGCASFLFSSRTRQATRADR